MLDYVVAVASGVGIGSVTFWGVVTCLGRSFLKTTIEKDFEAYKDNLQALSKERFLRFSKLIEVKHIQLSELHIELVEIHYLLRQLNMDETLDESEKKIFFGSKIGSRIKDLSKLYFLARPYMNAEASDGLLKLITKMQGDVSETKACLISSETVLDKIAEEIADLFV